MRSLRAIRGLSPFSNHSPNPIFFGAVVAVFLAVIYRFSWLGKYSARSCFSRLQLIIGSSDAADPYKCKSILNQGYWLDPAAGPHHHTRSFQKWDPPGCLLQEFKAKDIASCFHKRRITLIGDSTIRQIYWAIAKKLDLDRAQQELMEAEKNEYFKHKSLKFVKDTVNVEFLWDPYLNSSNLHDALLAYRAGSNLDFPNLEANSESPALMLVGAGQWYARFVQNDPLKHFKDAIDEILPFTSASTDSAVGAGAQLLERYASSDLLLFAPVQAPLYDKLSPARAATLTPERIDPMTDYLQQLSANQGLDVIWSYSLMTHQNRAAYEEGGLHVVDNVAARKADILLNLRCNTKAAIPQTPGYPYDHTCCTTYGRPGWLQWFGLSWGLAFLPLVVWRGSRSEFES
jgi:hypothetical protein